MGASASISCIGYAILYEEEQGSMAPRINRRGGVCPIPCESLEISLRLDILFFNSLMQTSFFFIFSFSLFLFFLFLIFIVSFGTTLHTAIFMPDKLASHSLFR